MSVFGDFGKMAVNGAGGMMGAAAGAGAAVGHGIYGMGRMLYKTPWWVTVPAAAGLSLVIQNGSSNPNVLVNRSINPTPGANPAYYPVGSGSSADMGAGGDIVMGLHKLSH